MKKKELKDLNRTNWEWKGITFSFSAFYNYFFTIFPIDIKLSTANIRQPQKHPANKANGIMRIGKNIVILKNTKITQIVLIANAKNT